MALSRRAQAWWDEFVQKFDELGYDINNPADRTCIFSCEFLYELDDKDLGIRTIGSTIEDSRISTAGLEYHKPEWRLAHMEPVSEEYINKVYSAASDGRLFINLSPNKPLGDESVPMFDQVRIVGISKKTGGVFISKNSTEIAHEASQEIQRRGVTGVVKKSSVDNEIERRELGDLKPTAFTKEVDAYNKDVSYMHLLAEAIASQEMLRKTPPTIGEEMSLEEYNIFSQEASNRREPVDTLAFSLTYKNNFELAVRDAHSKGLESEYLKNIDMQVALSKPAGRSHEQHLNDLFIKTGDKTALETLVGNDVQLFDKDMKPVDFSDLNKVKENFKNDGFYFFKPGSEMPTKVQFNKLTNSLTVNTKELAVPEVTAKPNFFMRAFNSINKIFGGSGIKSVEDYYAREAVRKVCENVAAKHEADAVAAQEAQEAQRQQARNERSSNENIIASLATAAKKEAKNLFQSLDSREKGNMYYLAGDTVSAWDKMAAVTARHNPDERSDFSRFGEPDNTYIARIVAYNMIKAEQLQGKTDIRDSLEKNGYKNFITALNNSEVIKKYKENITPEKIKDLAEDRGLKLSRAIAENRIKKNEPTVNNPVRDNTRDKAVSQEAGRTGP